MGVTLRTTVSIFLLLLPSKILSQSGWAWQNPLPQGNSFFTIGYLDKSTILVGGSHGTLYISIDGGITWNSTNSPTSTSIFSLSAPSSNSLFMASCEGIFRSIDLGYSWTKIDSEFCPHSVSFVDFAEGIAVGNTPFDFEAGSRGVILRTSDGGMSWSKSYLGIGVNLIDCSLHRSGFGIAIGLSNFFYVTTNMGTTWQKQTENQTLGLSRCLVLDSVTAFITGTQGVILRSVNRGISWEATHTSVDVDLFGISFTNRSVGRVVGNNGIIIATSDGGANWIVEENNYKSNLYAIDFINGASGVAVGNGGSILTTVDSGNVWSNISKSVAFDDLRGVSTKGKLVVTAVGLHGTIIHTIDGGNIWNTEFSGTLASLYDVTFFNTDTNSGIVVGQAGTILRTLDDGQTWISSTSGVSKDLHAVSILPNGIAIAVGDDGTITKSTDFGETWFPQTSGIGWNLHSVKLLSSTCAVAAGDNGVMRTSNAGSSWDVIFPYAGSTAMDFVDSTTGFLSTSGQSTYMLKTTNGGSSWSYLRIYSGHIGIHSIHAISPSTLVAVGDIGMIFRTTDAGQTWTSQSNITDNVLWDISFSDESNGTIVGAAGTILRTNSGGLVTAIESPVHHHTSQYHESLLQNYPNPFNPLTVIQYQLPVITRVTITIYDMLGRKVTTLVNKEQSPGSYSVTWDGTLHPSGVYFYRLSTRDFVETKKLILAK